MVKSSFVNSYNDGMPFVFSVYEAKIVPVILLPIFKFVDG